MNRTTTTAALAALLVAGATSVHAAAVDLTGWAPEGDGTWVVQTGNDSVRQTKNGQPTVFHDGANSQGLALAGTIEVTTVGDDDFIGFVLGYQTGDLVSATAEYLLIDWKKAYQTSAPAGLALSLVQGSPTGTQFWEHTGAVTELARGATLGATGWVSNTAYTFDLEFTSDRVKVFVDSVLQIDVTAASAGLGAFADGAFGFYNYSQSNVLYAGITEDVLPPAIPAPAALPLLLSALAGIGLMRRRRR